METDLQEELRAILTKLENAIAHDILLRQSQSRSGRSPKSIHAEAIASLTSLITRKQTSELMSVHRYMRQWDSDNVHGQTSDFILNRVKELKTLAPGGSDNETN